MQSLHIWAKSVIDSTPGLSQKGLAKVMGLNPAAVNRMLHGARKIKVDEVPLIEEYLGKKYIDNIAQRAGDFQIPVEAHAAGGQMQHSARTSDGMRVSPIPVYGRQDESIQMNLDDDAPVDWVIRHPALNGVQNAFAVYVFSGDMKPRYFPGELVYVHPGRPPEVGKDCLVKLKNGQAVLRRYVDRDGDHFHVRKYNPRQEDVLKLGDIAEIYMVVGRG